MEILELKSTITGSGNFTIRSNSRSELPEIIISRTAERINKDHAT